MNIEYHKWYSSRLQQEMELKVYGHAGKPVLVFPSQGGRFFEYEDFGMVGSCLPFIDAGKIQLITVDSVDNQSWANTALHPADRARRHNDYDQYLYHEVVPFIHQLKGADGQAQKILTTGCSMGAYHAPNFFFRHPDVCDAVIALSGLLRLNYFIGDYMDDLVYFHTPLSYLDHLNDAWYLDQYRQSHIIVCVGQGAWEEPMLADARALLRILIEKNIPCWIDFWGYDVSHDWPWWRMMMPYFLGKMFA